MHTNQKIRFAATVYLILTLLVQPALSARTSDCQRSACQHAQSLSCQQNVCQVKSVRANGKCCCSAPRQSVAMRCCCVAVATTAATARQASANGAPQVNCDCGCLRESQPALPSDGQRSADSRDALRKNINLSDDLDSTVLLSQTNDTFRPPSRQLLVTLIGQRLRQSLCIWRI